MEGIAPFSMQGAGYGSFTIVFEVADVDAEYERLKILGVSSYFYRQRIRGDVEPSGSETPMVTSSIFLLF